MGARRFLQRVALVGAVRYLTNARYPIGRVATLLGYSRQSSFTQWFCLHFGTTPRQWRAAHAK